MPICLGEGRLATWKSDLVWLTSQIEGPMNRKRGKAKPVGGKREGIPTPYWVAGLVLLHAALLMLVLGRRVDFLFSDAVHRLGPGTDFFAYYNAGRHWLLGEGAYGHGPGFGFRYHPAFAATIGAVLARFDPAAAYAIWVGLLEACFFFVWFLLSRLVESRRHLLFGILLLVGFSPYYLEVYMGNSSFLVAAMLFGGFYFYRNGSVGRFALLFTASLLVKPIGLIFLPILIVDRRFRMAGAILLAIVVLAAPFFWLDPQGWHRFLAINVEAIPAAGWVVHAGNQGLHGLIADLCARTHGISTRQLASFGDLPGLCPSLLWALPFLFIAVSAVATWKGSRELGGLLFLWSATYLLGYKDVWEHSYSFLILGFGWMLAQRTAPRRLLWVGAVVLALPTGFAFYDIDLPPGPIDPEHHWSAAVSLIHHATKSLPLLVVYLSVVVSTISRWRGLWHRDERCANVFQTDAGR